MRLQPLKSVADPSALVRLPAEDATEKSVPIGKFPEVGIGKYIL